ncbi:hypothetical protein BH23ACT3_BH23ACT3_17670 [soil metagenome]
MHGDGEIGIRELRNHTTRVIDRVARGEAVYLTRRGKRIARIEPVGRTGRSEWGERFLRRLEATPAPDLSGLTSLLDHDNRHTLSAEVDHAAAVHRADTTD